MNTKQRAGQLLTAQKTNRKRFRDAVLAALVLLPAAHLVTVAALAPRLVHALGEVHQRGRDLAQAHADAEAPPDKAQQRAIQLGIEAAAAGLAAPLLRSLIGREDDLATLAQQAVRESNARIELTADTELFKSYNQEWVAAVSEKDPDSTLVWVAILDKRTCNECSRLDGSTVKTSVGFDNLPPLHGRCRCYLETQ